MKNINVKDMDFNKISRILFFVFLAAFIGCTAVVITKVTTAHSEKKGYDALAEIVAPAVADNSETQAEAPVSADAPAVPLAAQNLDKLQQMNPDFYGWISIPDTQINYPVVFTPDEPAYYLRRDFQGNKASAGVPFLSDGCTPRGNSFIIHGHNMKDGTMFADLMKYRNADFAASHPYIQFDTPDQKSTYSVMGAFQYDAENRPDLDFRLYNYTGRLNGDEFSELTAYVQQHSLYDTGVTASYGDSVLILSTCTNGREFDRFIVVARKTSKIISDD